MIRVLLLLSLVGCATLPDPSSLIAPRTSAPEKEIFTPAWINNLDPKHDTGNLPIALNWPLAHEELLFVGDNSGVMRAFDIKTGQPAWSAVDRGGYHAGPVIDGEVIYYGNVDGRLYARNWRSGNLLYSIDLGASIETAPVIARGRLLVHARNHKIFCLDARTGKIIWAYKRSVPQLTTIQRSSRPYVSGQKVFVGFADGFMSAFSLEEGVLLWERKVALGNKFVDVDSSPIIFEGRLITGPLQGPMTVLSPGNGNVFRTIPVTISRAPLVIGKRLFAPTVDGELIEFDRNFKEVRKIRLTNAVLGDVVEWKDGLAVGAADGRIFAVSKDDLSVRATYYLGHTYSAVFGPMAQGQGMLAVLSSRNRLYVFK
jgi:outer membrane protein assembly factor BamB